MEKSIEGQQHTLPSSDAASNLSAQVFSDPGDFLKTLRSSFKEISHGHGNQLTIEDLRDAASHGSNPKIRAASAIAAEHIEELGQIYDQRAYLPKRVGKTIAELDLDFAIDMNDHKTLPYIASNVTRDIANGALIGVFGVSSAGTGLMVFESTAMAVGSLGLGALGVAAGGYLGYRAFQENSKLHRVADEDSAMFRSWLK